MTLTKTHVNAPLNYDYFNQSKLYNQYKQTCAGPELRACVSYGKPVYMHHWRWMDELTTVNEIAVTRLLMVWSATSVSTSDGNKGPAIFYFTHLVWAHFFPLRIF